jgi:3-hydroxyisobutyrate dehydrogenase-like beta-hydroxyacid dehydrogenase
MIESKSPPKHIGVLHPGAMGAAIGAGLVSEGFEVIWLSSKRSEASAERAKLAGLKPVSEMAELCEKADVIFSICPPHAATAVAQSVALQHYRGIYVDANAISPQEVENIAVILSSADIDFVDGGIIGPAARQEAVTLYLSGESADSLALVLSCKPAKIQCIGTEVGQASALKMCYAAVSKGSSALQLASLMAASQLGVDQQLLERWSEEGKTAPDSSALQDKAWRFIGEMQAIADTFEAVGVTPDFHNAAKEIYTQLAEKKLDK